MYFSLTVFFVRAAPDSGQIVRIFSHRGIFIKLTRTFAASMAMMNQGSAMS